MIYLLYGTTSYLIQKEVNKIREEHKIEDINISAYDLENSNWQEILEDVNTISLFAEKKMVIVDNATIFTGTTKKSNTEQDSTLFEEYFKKPNPDSILLFKVTSEKLDERKKVVKAIRKTGTVKDFNVSNPDMIVKNLLEDYQMDANTTHLLIERVGSDIDTLSQEIAKIKAYKDTEKKITKEDVLLLTSQKVDTDIFILIDSIVQNNKQTAISIYHEMLKQNEEPIKIIVMLANQFRIMYQAKRLSKKGHTENEIASILSIHPYRIKLALQKSRDYTEKLLLTYLNELANMDCNIKTGIVDKDLALELFILAK